jgi:hypothetical protein
LHILSHCELFSSKLTLLLVELQPTSTGGGTVSLRPPPKAAAKGPAKQVSEKKASEYAKLEDQLFEL